MTQKEILEVLQKVQAVISDSHVVYTSGKHGSAYVNKDALYQHPVQTALICQEMAQRFKDEKIDVVVGPALGGIVLSQWVGYYLTQMTGAAVRSVYAEKTTQGTGFIIKRGYELLIPGKRVLVVEDILTTGGSAKRVVETVRSLGGDVVGLSVLCNRGGVGPEAVASPKRLEALVSVTLDAWDPGACPLCQAGTPVNTSVGYGKQFLAQQK